MNRDPIGLGFLLYGFAPVRPGALLAAGMTLDLQHGHDDCGIGQFCRNPLHPGPCAGWKKKLGVEAPGALHAIEQAHREKVAANRVKRAEAKSAAAKTLTSRHYVSPLHAKKALTKRANMLLGNDESKASGKADKVILNKQEIAKYSKIKAAHVNSIRTKHGLQEDPGLEDRLKAALAEDNKNGKDDNYRAAIEGSSASLGAQLAQEHCKKGDGDCDGIPYENLRNELAADAHTALLTGDDSSLDQTLADYKAGQLDVSPTASQKAKTKIHDAETAAQVNTEAASISLEEAAKLDPGERQAMHEKLQGVADGTFGAPTDAQKQMAADLLDTHFGEQHPASAKSKAKAAQLADNKAKAGAMMGEAKAKTDKIAEDKKAAAKAENKAKAAEMMDAAKAKAAAVAAPKPPPAPKKAAPAKKAKGPVQLEGNAALADKGMKFGLGLQAFAKGNKTLGTKAAQKSFADKIEAHLNGDESKAALLQHGADIIAGTLEHKAALHLDSLQTQKVMHGMLAEEIAQGLTGKDGPFPMVEAFKKGVEAKTLPAIEAAKAEALDVFKQKAAEKLGVDVNLPAPVIGAKVLFKPGTDYGDGKVKARRDTLNELTPEHFGMLDKAEQDEIGKWLQTRADTLEGDGPLPDNNLLQEVVDLQAKFGLPVHQPAAPAVDIPGLFPPGGSHTDKITDKLAALQGLDKAAFDQLPFGTQARVHLFLDHQHKLYKPGSESQLEVEDLQGKFGFTVGETPPHVATLKDAIASGAPDWQIKQEAEKLSPDELQQHLTDAELAAVVKAEKAPPAAVFDPYATPPSNPGEVVTPDGALIDLHQMFGDDGDPHHGQVVEAVTAMTQEDWNALTPQEQGNLWAHLQDANSAGEPGAAMNKIKISTFEKAATPAAPKPKPVVSTSPEAKKAAEYATGVTSGTAKTKLTAYEKVTGEEFQALTGTEQQLILADLLALKGKFLDPKKKAQAQEHHDYLTGFVGGPGATTPTAGGTPSDAEKLDAGSAVLADMVNVMGDAPDPAKAVAAGTGLLAKAQANGSYDQLAQQMGEFQATIGMEKLGKLHTLNADAVKEITPKLQADIVKKLHASKEPTPVYDAWLKAMQDGSPANLKALEDAAGGPPLAAAPKPASHTDVQLVKGSTSMVLHDAWMGHPDVGAIDAKVIDAHVKEALSEGIGSPKHLKWAKGTSEDAAKITLDSAHEGMDFTPTQEAAIPAAVKEAAEAVLAHDYEQALLSADAYTHGKPADYLKNAVAEINKASAALAAAQGWDVNAPQIHDYEQQIWQAKLENLPKLWPVPAAAAPSAAKPASTSGPVALGHGAATAFTDEQQQVLTGTIKAHNVNLASNSQSDWNVLVATAKAQAGKDGLPATLSVMDVLNAVDAGHAKNLGVPNLGKLREKVLNWLKTPAGKKYAEDNAAPKSGLLAQMTGELSIKLPPGVKIQPTGGPGGYVASYKPTAPGSNHTDGWRMQTWQEALADREAYWAANPGTKWTAESKSALHSYTLGSATMNNWLRGETPSGQPVLTASHSTKQAVLDVQAAMVPLQRDMFLKRGTGWEQFPPDWRSLEKIKQKIGQNFSDKGFLSTSVTGGGSQGFGGAVKLEIEAPKGTHGIMVEDISAFKGGQEQEMILAAGTTMRVLSVKKVGGTTVVRVRVVTPK